ncbi:acetylcholine receptor subunit alpha-like [Mercenaria mercenaria]|uniref:acetylcholine receptor subunit alpha-like n=1 Tax=Mercenaria mercenaria TaxID=6596 RepID=UPI00234EDE4B|nr:acetylcholine receptor subunit alpha-like [Mercenaria mercenaria]
MIKYLLILCFFNTVRTSEHYEGLLHEHLFKDYIVNVRPVSDYQNTVFVTLALSLRKILHLDEIHQSFKTTVNILLYWKDEMLTWNETEYHEISSLEFPFHKNIWTPDLMIYNALKTPGKIGMKGAFVRLYSNGQVFVWTQTNIDTACEIRTKKYPFDEQTCKIIFAKFISSDRKVMITPITDSIDMAEYVEVAEWDIIENQATTEVRPYNISKNVLENASEIETLNYTYITYTLKMKRSCRLCFHNVIIPVLVLAALNMLTFFVPCESGEKTSFPISIFLTLAVFLTMITQSLPESVDGVSYLSSYVTFQLAISAVTLFSAVISLHLHYKKGNSQVPKYVHSLVSVLKFGRSSVTTKSEQAKGDENCFGPHLNGSAEGNKTAKEVAPVNVSYTFDRLMFVLLLLCETITTVIFIEQIIN